VSANILGPGDTIASVIANQFGEASGTHRAALIGCGVVLFAITIVISMGARALATRADRRSTGT
jgi:phosphate transport system permease protein